MSPVSIGSNSGFTIAAGTPNNVPIDAGQRVSGLLSLTIVQVDTILSLISLPENSRIQWWENYNYIHRKSARWPRIHRLDFRCHFRNGRSRGRLR